MGIKKHLSFNSKDTIFLDSNIFIYALEDETSLGQNSRFIFTQIKQKLPRVYTSVLTIKEVLTGVFQEHLEEKLPLYIEFISGGGLITIVDFNKNIAILAAQIHAEYRLKTPDSIQIATALTVKAKKFFTADKGFPKKIEELEIYTVF